jgi:hypothetical protein
MSLYALIRLEYHKENNSTYETEQFLGIFTELKNAYEASFKLSSNSIWPVHITIRLADPDELLYVAEDNETYIVNKHEDCIFDKNINKLVYGYRKQNASKEFFRLLEYGEKIKDGYINISEDEQIEILNKLNLEPWYNPLHDYNKSELRRFSNPVFVFGLRLKDVMMINGWIERFI